jgi:predicted metalloprotease with PDZ domain
MKYFISRDSVCSQFIQVTLSIFCEENEWISLQVAAWRPGRYELVNFAKNIRKVKVYKGNVDVGCYKSSKDCWKFTAKEKGSYQVEYEYYCAQMDAGGCWSDDQQLYLNFSNFIFEVIGRDREEIQIEVDFPESYQVATPLKSIPPKIWIAKGYQEAMDSPWIASNKMTHTLYDCLGCRFQLWFIGDIHFSISDLKKVFYEFTKKMITDFGSFPAEDYHFIFQLLPYRHYHGVEHKFSTVITIGQAIDLAFKKNLDELIGVSSHELYHFWNVCRIRPHELLKYDLSKEVYLDSGFILEGITSYMGDIYLLRSGYFTILDYLRVLEKQIQKESDNLGWKNETIVDSSLNLWLDGYIKGIPEDKVNIYNRGSLISLCLDLKLIHEGSGLHLVMKALWEKFGINSRGYLLNDFLEIVKSESQEAYKLINTLLFKKLDMVPILAQILKEFGISLTFEMKENSLLHRFGIRIDEANVVTQIHPESKAFHHLMIGDVVEIERRNEALYKNHTAGAILKINRFNRKLQVSIPEDTGQYFPKIKLSFENISPQLDKWIK